MVEGGKDKKKNFRIELKHTGHFLLTLSAKTFIMHLRLSSYRLWSALGCIITYTTLSRDHQTDFNEEYTALSLNISTVIS